MVQLVGFGFETRNGFFKVDLVEVVVEVDIGIFIIIFSNRFVLTYMNWLDREALSPFFVFPDEVNNSANLILTKLIKHQIIKENIVSIIEEMINTGMGFYEMNKAQMTIKMTYNIKSMFKAFSLIIRDPVLFEHKNKEDFFRKFESSCFG